MTETVRTTADLLARMADSAAAHSTTREMLRDMAKSFDATRSAQVNPKDAPYLAAGDGVADDSAELTAAIGSGASPGMTVVVPPSTYLTTTQSTVQGDTLIQGNGRSSVLKTVTVSMNHLAALTAGIAVRALSFLGVKGTTVLNNSAVVFNASDGSVEDCEASGMSGMALRASASDHIRFFKNYVHDLSADSGYTDSCDIAFYSTVNRCIAGFNRLMGGAQTETGILLQLNSTKNLVIGNEVGAHYSYGIIDYDTTPRHTNSIIALNRVEDIDGSAGGAGTKGAGVYLVGTGGQIVSHNQISNTNINTTTETLAPGAIGLNGPFSPVLVQGNMIWVPNWYGIMVVASTSALVELANNHVFESLKMAFYVKASSHVSINGGSVTALTATPLLSRAIGINVAGGGPFTNVSVKGVHIRGGSLGIDTNVTNKLSLVGNTVSEVGGVAGGIRVTAGDAAVVADNNVDVTSNASAPALSINGMTNSTFKGNVLKSTSATCVTIAGTNTGSVFDESNVLVGMDMNNVNNAGSGMKVTLFGTAAPTVKAHQVADRVINSVPAVGSPKAWVCTVAGTPGTWVSEGNL